MRTISNESIVGFASTAQKYPWVRMLENIKICRNIAPPMQLKPKPWKARCILRLKVESSAISVPYTIRFLAHIFYESRVMISANRT